MLRSRLSLLAGLSAGLLLAGAGAYAISLNSIGQPSARDLPVIGLTRAVDPVSAPATRIPGPAPTTPAPAPAPSPAANGAEPPHREVVGPKLREEDADDDHERGSDAKPGDGESSSGETAAADSD